MLLIFSFFLRICISCEVIFFVWDKEVELGNWILINNIFLFFCGMKVVEVFLVKNVIVVSVSRKKVISSKDFLIKKFVIWL